MRDQLKIRNSDKGVKTFHLALIFPVMNHVYARFDDSHNHKDVCYDHLGNQYIRSVYDFHN